MGKNCKSIVVGDTYGRLTVMGAPYYRQPGDRHLRVDVQCSCGVSKTVYSDNLVRGKVRSCGCLNIELIKKRSITHHKRSDPLYPVWNMMVQRCHNPRHRDFANYGGRGIQVCDEWRTFEGFYQSMRERPFKGASLERVDNDKGYSPDNVVWATRTTQNRNRRNTVKVMFQGRETCLAEVAATTGISYSTLYQRLFRYYWPIEQALKP